MRRSWPASRARRGWTCAEGVRRPAGQHGEKNLAGKTGGAVTLAVGMAKVFSSLPGMKALMGYWYHFVIMFEALFILTLLETGTRVARFIFQETVHQFLPKAVARRRDVNLGLNIVLSATVCALWGYLLYSGNIATLWRMMGIANQLLATIALAVGTTYLLQHAPRRVYALCTGIPLVFVVATVFTAGDREHSELVAGIGDPRPRLAGSLLFAARIDPGGHHVGVVRPGGSRFRAALGRVASCAAPGVEMAEKWHDRGGLSAVPPSREECGTAALAGFLPGISKSGVAVHGETDDHQIVAGIHGPSRVGFAFPLPRLTGQTTR